MPKLSVVIITQNEEKNILRCLESVKPVADEIVVVDSMSADHTCQICREYGCRVFLREFDGYGSQKQFAVNQACNDWVLSIDADEVVSEELRMEINKIFEQDSRKGTESQSHRVTKSQSHKVTESQGHRVTKAQSHRVTEQVETGFTGQLHSGYNIPFSLYFMGRLLKHGGVGTEFHLRLFNRTEGGFTTVPVHEGVEVKGSAGNLKGCIIHYSYRDISHHIGKINTYTTQAAEGYLKNGKSFSKTRAVLKFPASFLSTYIIKLGFLDGYPGFMWAFLAAVYATLKAAKTIESTRKT